MNYRVGFVLLALMACLVTAVPVRADQNDPRLRPLFDALLEHVSPANARLLETRIWSIWTQHGNVEVVRLMKEGGTAMGQGRLPEAADFFRQITERAPSYAEGWNKLATVNYMMGEFEQSIEEVGRTLKLEPRHFGALAGLGLNFEKLGNAAAARDAYERALAVNPYMFNIRLRLENLKTGPAADDT